MPRNSEEVKTCKYCNLAHENPNPFENPAYKSVLYKLQAKLKEIGRPYGSGSWDWVEKYAIQRKLKSVHGVVMCGYGKLVEAYSWLIKLEEFDKKIDASRPQVATDLPF